MKIWTLPLKYAEDKVWEHSKDPLELEFKDDLLENIKFGEVPVIEMTLIPKRTILLLFKNKNDAEIYLLGFKFGSLTQSEGDDIWQHRLDSYIEHEVSKDDPVTDSDGLRGFKL